MPESPATRPARDGLRITGVRTIVTAPRPGARRDGIDTTDPAGTGRAVPLTFLVTPPKPW
jgi:hypothetical protein